MIKNYIHQVIESSIKWQNSKQLMYVVGANHTDLISNIREIVPDNFLTHPWCWGSRWKFKRNFSSCYE